MKLATQKIQLGLIFLLLTGASSAYSKDLPKGQVMPEASGSSNLTLTVDGLRNIDGVLRIGIWLLPLRAWQKGNTLSICFMMSTTMVR